MDKQEYYTLFEHCGVVIDWNLVELLEVCDIMNYEALCLLKNFDFVTRCYDFYIRKSKTKIEITPGKLAQLMVIGKKVSSMSEEDLTLVLSDVPVTSFIKINWFNSLKLLIWNQLKNSQPGLVVHWRKTLTPTINPKTKQKEGREKHLPNQISQVNWCQTTKVIGRRHSAKIWRSENAEYSISIRDDILLFSKLMKHLILIKSNE